MTARATMVRGCASKKFQSTSTGAAWLETWLVGSPTAKPALTEPKGSGCAAVFLGAQTAVDQWRDVWASPSTSMNHCYLIVCCLYYESEQRNTESLVLINEKNDSPKTFRISVIKLFRWEFSVQIMLYFCLFLLFCHIYDVTKADVIPLS